MSYGFDMGFAQANSLQEAMMIALEYTQSQMTEKNVKKSIRDNLYYQPISKSWSPNLCPHCDADLGGDCNDGYYQNPHYERCPVCGQKLKYI